MNPSTSPDPVNRWATEHYGFDDEPTPPAPAVPAPPQVSPPLDTSRARRRSVLVTGGVLGLLLTAAGAGGVTMAANAADGGFGDGRGDRSSDGGPGGGAAGGPDGGRR